MPRVRVIIVCLSLTANAALAIALWPRLSSRSRATAAPQLEAGTALSRTNHPEAMIWSEIVSTADDAGFMDRLRAEGFPPEIVRALTGRRIYERFKPRFDALKQKAPPPKPYWQTSSWRSPYEFDSATRAEQRALWREMDDAIKAIIGSDIEPPSAYRREQLARTYGPLPSEKISALEAITRDYDELTQAAYENARGVMLASDRQQLAFLEKEKRADIACLLSPEELEEYDRRNSPAAEETRDRLRFFNSAEDDFLKIYALQRAFDERYGRDNLSGEAQDLRTSALPELDRQIEAALGPERYADFQVSTDVNFTATRATLDRVGLSPDLATDLVRIQRDAKKRAQLIRNDTSLTGSQRNERLASLQKEATDKASTVLGTAENLDMFKRTAGQWLGKLVSPTDPYAK